MYRRVFTYFLYGIIVLCGLAHSTLLQDGQSALGPATSGSDVSTLFSESWEMALKNGEKLLALLKMKLDDHGGQVPDNESGKSIYNGDDYTKTIEFGEGFGRRIPLNKPFLGSLGIDKDEIVCYAARIDRPVEAPLKAEVYHSLYSNLSPTWPGVIYTTDAFRNKGLLHLSDAIFYSWEDFSRKANAPIDGLKFIVQEGIENTATRNVMWDAHDAYMEDHVGFDDGGKPIRLQPHDRGFVALLGSENFAGYVRMLIDHSVALQKLGIDEIAINPYIGSMAFILGKSF